MVLGWRSWLRATIRPLTMESGCRWLYYDDGGGFLQESTVPYEYDVSVIEWHIHASATSSTSVWAIFS